MKEVPLTKEEDFKLRMKQKLQDPAWVLGAIKGKVHNDSSGLSGTLKDHSNTTDIVGDLIEVCETIARTVRLNNYNNKRKLENMDFEAVHAVPEEKDEPIKFERIKHKHKTSIYDTAGSVPSIFNTFKPESGGLNLFGTKDESEKSQNNNFLNIGVNPNDKISIFGSY